MCSKDKTAVIVVIYNSSEIKIRANALGENIILIIVDNTPGQNLGIKDINTFYIPLFENKGIAFAQNQGLKKAIIENCEFIVFLDQDSLIESDYVPTIILEYKRISQNVPNLFLLGPKVFNGRTNEEYKSTIHKDHSTDFGFTPRREIISSGSCTKINCINAIGFLDDELFIDYVDFEWCWRGNALKYSCGLSNRVTLTHFVGCHEYKFLNQLVIISSPIRYYYQIRNYIWLLKRKYVPFQWKVNTGIKNIAFSFTYPFNVPNWKTIYRYIFNGIKDGIRNKKAYVKP